MLPDEPLKNQDWQSVVQREEMPGDLMPALADPVLVPEISPPVAPGRLLWSLL